MSAVACNDLWCAGIRRENKSRRGTRQSDRSGGERRRFCFAGIKLSMVYVGNQLYSKWAANNLGVIKQIETLPAFHASHALPKDQRGRFGRNDK
jgi:hypothetical protein